MPDSPAIQVTGRTVVSEVGASLKTVARQAVRYKQNCGKVALSALLRGCAEVIAGLAGAIRVTGRSVVSEVGASLQSLARVALSALLRGCAEARWLYGSPVELWFQR